MCGRRRLAKQTPHVRSALAQQLLFPQLPTPPSTYSQTPPSMKSSQFPNAANLSTQTSSFLDLAKLLHATDRRHRHHTLDNSDTDTLSSMSGDRTLIPITPATSTLESTSTQTSFGENVCTQTDKNSATQTYDTLRMRYYESLGRALGLRKAGRSSSKGGGSGGNSKNRTPLTPPTNAPLKAVESSAKVASVHNPPHPYSQTSTPFTGDSRENSENSSPVNVPKWSPPPPPAQDADAIYQSLNKLANKYGK